MIFIKFYEPKVISGCKVLWGAWPEILMPIPFYLILISLKGLLYICGPLSCEIVARIRLGTVKYGYFP